MKIYLNHIFAGSVSSFYYALIFKWVVKMSSIKYGNNNNNWRNKNVFQP